MCSTRRSNECHGKCNPRIRNPSPSRPFWRIDLAFGSWELGGGNYEVGMGLKAALRDRLTVR